MEEAKDGFDIGTLFPICAIVFWCRGGGFFFNVSEGSMCRLSGRRLRREECVVQGRSVIEGCCCICDGAREFGL